MIRATQVSLFAALAFILSPLVVASAALAQDILVSESNLRAEMAASLPAWWRLDDFEVDQIGGDELLRSSSNKRPGPVALAPNAPEAPEAPEADEPTPAETGKPIPRNAPLSVEQVVRFRATLELTQELYEPVYAMDGAAFVTSIVAPGLDLEVTGTVGLAGSGEGAQIGAFMLDQAGLETLGKPLDGFDLPAFLIGSDEATIYLEERAAERAEGTLNKLLSDEGEEL